ncbi:MAG TPA: hypothetical protein VFP97_16340 [Chitinophagaceae bacterium]|nr:hypothetical protein [Chitinophagaceae bacterium]
MALDQNEKKFIEKLVAVLKLLNANEKDVQLIANAKKIDDSFLKKAGKIFDKTEACTVCRNAFYTWRNSLDDDTVLSFIDEWINWKVQNPDSKPAIPK